MDSTYWSFYPGHGVADIVGYSWEKELSNFSYRCIFSLFNFCSVFVSQSGLGPWRSYGKTGWHSLYERDSLPKHCSLSFFLLVHAPACSDKPDANGFRNRTHGKHHGVDSAAYVLPQQLSHSLTCVA